MKKPPTMQTRCFETSEESDMTLIEKLRAATEGSRELDVDIATLVGAPHGPREDVDMEARSVTYIKEQAPHYTTNIDAALTLVPEGWSRHFSEGDNGEWWAELRKGYATSYTNVVIKSAPTFTLAICIAALTARENEDGRD